MHQLKMTDQIAGHEIAGHENARRQLHDVKNARRETTSLQFVMFNVRCTFLIYIFPLILRIFRIF